MIKRYDINQDEEVEVSQIWFNKNQHDYQITSKRNAVVKYAMTCDEADLNKLLSVRQDAMSK